MNQAATNASTEIASTEIQVQDLAILVAGMSRFLTRLSNMPAFQEAGFGLAEWSALSIIAGKTGIHNGQLAMILGVSAQRINQVTDSLKAGALISISTAADDARKKTIFITPTGTARLRELNAKLQPAIATALNKREKLLGRLNGIVGGILMRIVVPPKSLAQKEAEARMALLRGQAAQR